MAKTKVPKFNSLAEFAVWTKAQAKSSVDRKEKKKERKRLENLGE